MKLLIVIPAYNEEKNIESVVNDLCSEYPQYDYVVVNDGSRDRTAEICEKSGFNFLDIPVNIGLAGAVQAGMQYASINGYDAVLQFDGDGQHIPKYIDDLYSLMTQTKTDIVIGSRFLTKKRSLNTRMMGSRLLQLLIFLVARTKLTDPTSGMRLFNKALIEEFAWNLNYGPEPDTIVYLMRNGITVSELPIEMNERTKGESYLNAAASIRYMMHMCISIIFIQWFRKRRK